MLLDDVDQGQDTSPIESSAAELDSSDQVAGKLVNYLMREFMARSGDALFVEGDEIAGKVRTRIDGHVHELMKFPGKLTKGVVNRIKVMARLDLDEQRLPQSGTMKLLLGHGMDLLLDVHTIPTVCGENLVVRSKGFNSANPEFGLDELGFDPAQLNVVRSALNRLRGMIIVCAPPGSGRIATLYTLLKQRISVSAFRYR